MEEEQVAPWGVPAERYSTPLGYQRYIGWRRTPPVHPDISPTAALLKIGALQHKPLVVAGIEPSIVGYFTHFVPVVQYSCGGAQTGKNFVGSQYFINRIDIARRAYKEAVESVAALPGGPNSWVDVRDVWQMTHGCCPIQLLNLMLE